MRLLVTPEQNLLREEAFDGFRSCRQYTILLIENRCITEGTKKLLITLEQKLWREEAFSLSKPLRLQLKLTLNVSVLPCLFLTCTFLPLKPGHICNCNHFTNQHVWLGSVPKPSISHQWRWHNFNLKPWFLSIQH